MFIFFIFFMHSWISRLLTDLKSIKLKVVSSVIFRRVNLCFSNVQPTYLRQFCIFVFWGLRVLENSKIQHLNESVIIYKV